MFDFVCEECRKGTVRERTINDFATKVRGYEFIVPTAVIGVCDNCGEQVFDPQEVRRWSELFTKYLESRGDLLSAHEVRMTRERLGLSIADFAKLIGSTRQSVYNWERQDRKIPQNRLADVLIRLVRESTTSGKVAVLEFLQDRARAGGENLAIRLTWNISVRRTEKILRFAPSDQFDELFQVEEPAVGLPALRY